MRSDLLSVLCVVLVTAIAGCDRKAAAPAQQPEPASAPRDSAATPKNYVESLPEPLPAGKKRVTIDGVDLIVDSNDEVHYTKRITSSSEQGNAKYNEQHKSKGVGLETSSKDAEQNFKQSPVTTSLSNGGGGLSSGFQYTGTLTGGKSINIYHIIGAGLLLFAAIYFYFTRNIGRSLTIALAGAGFVAIGVVVDEYPWVALATVLLFLALGGIWLYEAWKKKKVESEKTELDHSLGTVVRGVENIENSAVKEVVKRSIATAAQSKNGQVKETIRKVKKKQGLE